MDGRPRQYNTHAQALGCPVEPQNDAVPALRGEMPVFLTSPGIPPHVRSMVERFRPQTTVMSQGEIHRQAKLKTMGTI